MYKKEISREVSRSCERPWNFPEIARFMRLKWEWAWLSRGKKKEAQEVIRGLQRFSGKRYVSPYGIAQIYAALDEKPQTYEWLETAYRDRAVWISCLAVDPLFDSIRPEPHFQDLLRRVGVPSHF